MKQVLLHACCAPCSAAILEWMLQNNVEPTLYFCNPNIYPNKEYQIRKQELTKYAQKLGLEVFEEAYNHAAWLCHIAGNEQDKERGTRCLECFKMRLHQTALKAQALGINTIATTLASSRWKNLEQISEAGKWAASQVEGVTFWAHNWRKDGLQERRNALLKENNFYNQNYCGCEFSIRE